MGIGIELGLDISQDGGVRYLFRDEFTTARDAGAVADSACESGPGNRTVRDVESKITIADGWLKFDAQATAVYAEEDVILGTALSRAAGVVDIRQYKVTTDQAHYPLALVTSATPTWNHTHVDAGLWRSAANTLSVIAGAALKGAAAVTVADGTNYYLACVLRSTGAFYYIKGGIYTTWTLLYASITGNTAALYRAAAGNLAVFFLGFERNSAARWLPTPGLNDGFGTAFGTSDGTGTIETSGIGYGGNNVTWTGSTWAVSGGKALNTPCLGSELLTNGNMETGDPPSNWSLYLTATLAAVADERTGGAGTKSLSIARVGNQWGGVRQQATIPQNKWVKLTGWVKNIDSDNGARVCVTTSGDVNMLWGNPNYITATTWTLQTITGRLTGDNPYVKANISATVDGQSARFDDISFKQLYFASLAAFPIQSLTANPWLEGVWSAKLDGTQWGFIVNADTDFAATVASTSGRDVALTNVTKAITTNDTLLDKANSVQYTIAAVGALSNGNQTVTLGADISPALAANQEVGIGYASWNGLLVYYDGNGKIAVDQVVNGTYSALLATTAVTYANTARLIVRVGVGAATNVDIYYAETKVGNTLTKPEALTGKYHGLFSTDVGNTLNNFVIYATDGNTPLNAFIN